MSIYWIIFSKKHVSIHSINKVMYFFILVLTHRTEESTANYIIHRNQRGFHVLVEHSATRPNCLWLPVAAIKPTYKCQINFFTRWQVATNKITKTCNTQIWGIIVDDYAVETWFSVKRRIASHDIMAFGPIFTRLKFQRNILKPFYLSNISNVFLRTPTRSKSSHISHPRSSEPPQENGKQ